ncbi:1,3-propanediol dehydrogenase [Ruminiclostridium hungatei]|uniref:1,3-propanediol dehydrogenase n=1 Tax=Ruminiclostridium hungatei TaxID=48256 RepID=A0A1V4SIZ7_RUMHU|nr:iron-containing alcohol dehydrogenase [Ruminiclostridium hungatei]OPX43774.1 1,3-propanediol dehydrogenase [Ruminiclostridium hungatei]
MSFNYYIPTRVLFGKGQLEQLHKQALPGRKALIVTSAGMSMKKYGYLARLEDQLKKADIDYVIFDKILPNPIKPHVMEGAALAAGNGCDFVIGLGGGSSIDSSKSIAVMATNPGDYWDYIGGGSGKAMPVPNDPLPVVAITTTAGTGTEADPWTVITNDESNEKIGFGYDKTFPVLSIVDPDLMMTVPPHLTAYQGFDALFHSTEGYVNRFANEMSDMYAIKSIQLLGKYLPTAVNEGSNEEAREKVALANTVAGMVESTSGCTSEHSLEHALSAFHPELPHGAGLIMVSEAYYTFFAKSGSCDQRLVDMAAALGKKDASEPMDFVAALVDLQKACGVYGLKMSDYGIKAGEIEALARNARHTMGGLFACDPAELSDENVVEILKKSYK